METGSVRIFNLSIGLFLCVVSSSAADTLNVIPSVHKPVFVLAGDTISISLPEKTNLVLKNSVGESPIEMVWAENETSVFGELSTKDLQPGKYALLSSSDSGDSQFLTTVFVLDAPKKEYQVAIVRNVLDSNELKRRSAQWEKDSVDWAAISGPVLKEDLDSFFQTASIPIIGLSDEDQDTIVAFGQDAWFFPGGKSNSRDLVKSRSAHLGSRWSVGIAPQMPVKLPVRSQMVLMVDMPLDYWVVDRIVPKGNNFGNVLRIQWESGADEIRLIVNELSIETTKK
jgi:hypothetical protein